MGYRASGPVDRAERVANLLDEAITIPVIGIEIGLDPLLTAIPVVGDAIGAIITFYIVLEGALAKVPWYILLLMIAIAVIDVAVGLVPYVGPVIDTFWKANTWNLKLMKRFGRRGW